MHMVQLLGVQIASFYRIRGSFDKEASKALLCSDEALISLSFSYSYLITECSDLGLRERLAREQHINLIIEALDFVLVKFSVFLHA